MSSGEQVIINRPQRLLREGLIASAKDNPDKVALIYGDNTYTYSDLLDASLRIAGVLREKGIIRGDRVAIYMENSWPCVVSIYSILMAGAVFLVINPQTKSDKLEFILNDSGAKILIADTHLSEIYLPAAERTNSLVAILASRIESKHNQKPQEENPIFPIFDFEEILESSKKLSKPVDIIPNDLAALIYTSGSTGFPKGVMQTHQSMVFAAWSLIEYQRLSANDRILLTLPIAFDYGLYQLLMSVKLGATLVLERSFTFPAQIYNAIIENNATVFPGVPTIFAMMISSHKNNNLNFPTITRVTNTAEALPPNFIPYLHEIFPNALIYKMYGLTECKRVSYLEPELVDLYPDSVGRAIPGTEVYLLNSEGKPVSPGETGTLYVRGPHVMVGYWNQPELTKKMLVPGKLPGERVLCTHDLFRTDENGLLYFISRSDDIIKTRGEKVSPVEIERVLHNIPEISGAVVIGTHDDILGQAITAFIVLEDDSELREKEIKKYCMAHLENFMIPKNIVFIEEIPRHANGKINKEDLNNFFTQEKYS